MRMSNNSYALTYVPELALVQTLFDLPVSVRPEESTVFN
jgi:hypothetical protein